MTDTPLTTDAVRWESRALGKLTRPEQRGLFATELIEAFREDGVQQFTVFDVFIGFKNDPLAKVILGVETVRGGDRRSHIVKLGDQSEVGRDYDGWRECIAEQAVRSRLFVRVLHRPLPPRSASGTTAPAIPRAAIVYENGYTLFGLNLQDQIPITWQEAAYAAIEQNSPDAESVERVLIQIYSDLGTWFYRTAQPDQQTAVEFYRQKVAKVASLWQADPAIPDTDRRAYRAVLRSDAIWLLSGRDKPEKPEEFEYLDPLDYVSWALAHDDLTVPETLVGPTHGDLHGQNILVGVQRNEAVWPVVFDYGEMGTRNLLVWDFVKLETELKTRVLPRLYHDAAARAALLSRPSRLPRGDHPSSPYTLPERDRADRANRLAFVFQFEKLLAEETSRIQSEDLAAARTPPRGRDLVPGQAPLNRILSILIRIRQEAALCLGYHHNGRFATWSEEFYFALAVYGLTTAKWETYEDPQTESVLISAGVACAQLGVARQALRPTAISVTASAHSSPHRPASYRVPLFLAHEAWKRKEHAVALALLQDAERQFPRCTPLQAEYALNLAEQGETERSIQLVEPLRALCHVFGDFETLTRIGRCFKEIADRQWQQLHDRINHVEGETVRQMFVSAFEVYYEAYRMSGDYFPGVNAATLALLSGQDPVLVHEIALSVKTVCQRARITTQRDDRYWIFASEGEVSLVLDDVNRAAECYLAALAELKAENLRFAQSTWNQVCRLWHFLGDRVEPVALVFERDPLVRTSLDLGPFENCRRNWPNRPLLSEINRQQAWRHFQKTKPIWARRLEQAETVKTLEGELHASAGDYVCRGIAGELWPQQANKLEAKYTPTDTIDPAGWRKFEPRPDAAGVFAAQVPRTFSVTATWGELKGKAGDYLVKHAANQKTLYPDDVWIVDQSLFDATYEWVDSPTMLAASPTEMRT